LRKAFLFWSCEALNGEVASAGRFGKRFSQREIKERI
jgi:hypothetical protein